MDNEAFEKAVVTHKDRVHSYAAMMLRDAAEAQDVAQEALVRLWRFRGQVGEQGARPWLMRTAHNLCIDRIRRRKVRAEVEEGETVMERQADDNPGPWQLARAGELGRRIDEALRALSSQDRAVVVMREVQGLPYDEIARSLGCSVSAVKVRAHRAVKELRRLYQELAREASV